MISIPCRDKGGKVIVTNNSKLINLIKYWGCLQNVNEDASFESGGDAILNVLGVSVAIICN
jgi:hypothetical protein